RPNSAAGIDPDDIGGIETVSVEATVICNCRAANMRAENRPGLWLVGRFRLLFLVLLPGERGGPPRAVFFQIRKHEILPRQQPVALAKSHGRRILCEELAFSRPGPVTLRCRDMVAHRWSIDFKTRELARRVDGGSRQPVDKCRRSDSAVARFFSITNVANAAEDFDAWRDLSRRA